MRALVVLEGAGDRPAQERCVRRLIPSAPLACSPVRAPLLLESLGRLLHLAGDDAATLPGLVVVHLEALDNRAYVTCSLIVLSGPRSALPRRTLT